MDQYLSKPIDIEQFKKVVARIQSQPDESAPIPQGKASATAVPQATPEPVLNINAPLKQFSYTPEQHHKLVTTMQSELLQRTEEILHATAEMEWSVLIRAAHTLKSAAQLFEARSLYNVAQSIEGFARAGETNEIPLLIAELRDASESVRRAIDDWLVHHPE